MRRYWTAGSLWAADRLVTTLIAAGVQIALARALGPAAFGSLSHALALVSLLIPLSQAGLSGQLVKNILASPDAEIAVLRCALFWRLAGALLAALIGGFFLVDADNEPAAVGFLALLFLGTVGTALQVAEASAQARSAPRELVPFRLLITLAAAAAKLAVLSTRPDPESLAWIFASEFLLQGLAQIIAYRIYRGTWLRPVRHLEWSRHFGTRAPWLVVSGLAEMIYLRIDIVMLLEFRGPAEAGVYATAARLSEGWYAVPQIIMVSVFPVLWQLRDSSQRWTQGVQATADALFWLAVIVALTTQLIAEDVVRVIFGDAYLAAAPVLALHVWAGVFVFTRALISRWLIAEDLIRISLWSHGAGALANVLLNLWLIPPYGAQGAAIATLVSYGVAGWVAFVIPRSTRVVAMQIARAAALPFRWRDLADYWNDMTRKRQRFKKVS